MFQKHCIQKHMRMKQGYEKKDIYFQKKRQQITDELRLI